MKREEKSMSQIVFRFIELDLSSIAITLSLLLLMGCQVDKTESFNTFCFIILVCTITTFLCEVGLAAMEKLKEKTK